MNITKYFVECRMLKVLGMALAVLVLVGTSVAFAQEKESKSMSMQGPQGTPGKAASGDAGFPWLVASIGFSLAIAAAFGALGQGRAITASVEAMARQPEAGGRIFTSMIIGLALIETLVIYTLVIAFTLAGRLA
jgi:ATP synthase F0 subunit c